MPATCLRTGIRRFAGTGSTEMRRNTTETRVRKAAGPRRSGPPAVRAAALTALALCQACAPDSSDSLPFEAVADDLQLMVSVIEPAAEVYWDAVGVIMDLDGTHEIEPRSDEEWEAVENAAWVLAESGNLLLMEDRARGREHWMRMSRSMIEVGRRAVDAAVAKDPQAVFDVGAEVYFVCVGCHAAYATETIRPSDMPDSVEADSSGGDGSDP